MALQFPYYDAMRNQLTGTLDDAFLEIEPAEGPNGEAVLSIATAAVSASDVLGLWHQIDVQQTADPEEYTAGFYYKPFRELFDLSSLKKFRDIIQFRDSSVTKWVGLRQEIDGRLLVDDEAGTIHGRSAYYNIIRTGNWHYIEISVSVQAGAISGTAVDYSVRINYDPVLSGSFQSASPNFTEISRIGMGGQSGTTGQGDRFSSLYIVRGFENWQGETYAYRITPTSDGTVQEWTAAGAGDNFVEVDETGAHDSDTTYVESSALAIDTYGCSDVSTALDVLKHVQFQAVARNTVSTVPVATIRYMTHDGSTLYTGPSTLDPLTTTYDGNSADVTINPATGATFTVAELNSQEHGFQPV